jgi:CBS domain-containing protein
MNVSKIMNQNVQSCKLGDSLETAAAIMWEHDLGCLPVLNSSEEIVGMVTDRDICMACYTQGLAPHNIRVSSAMSQAVFSCTPEDSIQHAAEQMSSHQVRRLPVLEMNGKLIGIISLNDLAREAEEQLDRKKQEIGATEVMNTLAAICHPREVQAFSAVSK